MNHLLEIDSVQLHFDGRKILSDIYLKSETGKISALLGKNGEGKSCLMKIIYGSLACERSLRLDRVSIVQDSRRHHLLKYLPQFNFIPKFLSLRQVFHDFSLNYTHFQQRFPEFRTRANTFIGSLSGGERRLIELYVIVKSAAQFAMLDEPFTHLNPLQIERAKEFLMEEKANKGLLITDHLYQHVIDISDSLYILANGKTFLTKSMADIETLGYARL